MSSSNILRKGGELPKFFVLEPLGEVLPTLEICGFRPVSLGVDDPQAEAEEAEPYQPPPCILEEEALRRIQQAHAEGVREGKRQAEDALSKVSEALAQALLATGSLRSRLLHESEEDLLKLSVLIARTVVLRELTLDPGILAGVVQGAVELASDAGEVVVRLSPEDHALVSGRPEFAALPGEKRRVVLKADPALGSAACLVETVRGNIDAGLEGQLDEIYRRLSEDKNERREEHGAN